MVGRAEELDSCDAVLGRRNGTGIVVAGAAGVGKTRLANEVLRVAAGAGYETVRVTATEAGRPIPLGPFAQLLPAGTDARTSVHLLRTAHDAIAARKGAGQLALLVDDAHLLDSTSATLVQQLAAERRVTVIATVRTGESSPDAIVALWKDHGCEYLELQPLSVDETGLLVESIVGGEVDGQTKYRVWRASVGLPLVVHELVAEGLERDLLTEHAGLWRWRGPLQARGRLLELIEARIGLLGDDERKVLELVALGEPLDWSLLDPSEAVAAEALLRRGVLEADNNEGRPELRLGHPLFGEAVRVRMSEPRAAAVQRRLADALEAAGLQRPGDVLRLALWRLEAGGRVSADLLLKAAGVAERSLDAGLAERLARAAVAAGGGLLAERAVARVLTAQGHFDEAEAILSQLAERAENDEERTWVALAQARTLLIGLGRGADAEAAVTGAQRLVSDPARRRELELVRCWILLYVRPAEAADASTALVDDGRAPDQLRARAAGIAAHALGQVGRPESALAVVDRWRPYAQEVAGDLASLLLAQFRSAQGLALLLAGRFAEAESAAQEAYDAFVGGPSTEVTALMALGRGRVALLQGSPREAWRWFRECSELLRDMDPGGFLRLAHALAAQALAQAGDTAGAEEAATAARKLRRTGTSFFDSEVLLADAWVSAAEGLLEEAQQRAAAAADLAEQTGGLMSAMLAAHDLLRLGDAGAACVRLTRLADEMQGSLVTACADHAAAIVSRSADRIELAAAELADLGARLWAAEAECAAASAYREAGRKASARAASARATLLLEQCGPAATPALGLTGPVEQLTRREREIAALAAAGASNREIAARLVLSIRTVENHLQRVYRKLGVGSRRDLPTLLARDGAVAGRPREIE